MLIFLYFCAGKSINFISRYRPLITESKVKSGDVKRVNRLQGMPKPTVADALGFKQVDFDAVDHYSTTNRPAVKSGTSLDNSSGAGVMTKEETCIESELQDLGYGSEARLTAVVNRMSTSINQNLLQMMIKDFYLFEHLSALKKFVLLGQGDFVTCLMDSVGPELQKSPSKLYRHNLSGILDGSLRSSNAQFEPTFVLNRVLVRLLESRPGDTGWEVFTLDYAIDAPLNAVVC